MHITRYSIDMLRRMWNNRDRDVTATRDGEPCMQVLPDMSDKGKCEMSKPLNKDDGYNIGYVQNVSGTVEELLVASSNQGQVCECDRMLTLCCKQLLPTTLKVERRVSKLNVRSYTIFDLSLLVHYAYYVHSLPKS